MRLLLRLLPLRRNPKFRQPSPAVDLLRIRLHDRAFCRLNKRADLPDVLAAVRLHAARYVDSPGTNRGDRPRDVGWVKAAGQDRWTVSSDLSGNAPVEGS